MTPRLRVTATAIVAVAVVFSVVHSGALRAHADDPVPSPRLAARATDLEAHLERVAPSIVTLKSLVNWGGDDESTTVSHGVIVDPSGLILLSGSELGFAGTKVRSIHVILGNDPKEWDAIFVARDSTLDLSYVQVLDLGAKALPAIDLGSGVDPKIGQDLFGVSRTGRGFDYAPAIRRLYVTCRIDNPRKMWDFTGEFAEAGLPVFDLGGQAVGLLSNQQSVEGGDDDGGSSSDVFLLPLDPVKRSLADARKRVPEALEKNEKAKAAAKEAEAAGKGDAGKGTAGMETPPAPPTVPPPVEPGTPGMGESPPSPEPSPSPAPSPKPAPDPAPAPPREPGAPR